MMGLCYTSAYVEMSQNMKREKKYGSALDLVWHKNVEPEMKGNIGQF